MQNIMNIIITIVGQQTIPVLKLNDEQALGQALANL